MIVVLMQSQVLINCSQFIEINYQEVEFAKKNVVGILSYDDYSLVKLPNLLIINMCQVKSQSSGLPMKE